MLVLDESGSIESSGQTENVRNATRAFLNALSGTGAGSRSWTSARLRRGRSPTHGDPRLRSRTFRALPGQRLQAERLHQLGGRVPEGARGEHAGDARGPRRLHHRRRPDGVQQPDGSRPESLTEGDVMAMRLAAEQADRVKEQGSHVLALGVGAAVTKAASERRLTGSQASIVSAAAGAPSPRPTTPWSRTSTSSRRRSARSRSSSARRRSASPSWWTRATASTAPIRAGSSPPTVSMSAGSYTWLQPAPPPETGPRSQLTDSDGVATFQWKPSDATATSTVSLEEDVKPGYAFVTLDLLDERARQEAQAHRPADDPAPDRDHRRAERVRACEARTGSCRGRSRSRRRRPRRARSRSPSPARSAPSPWLTTAGPVAVLEDLQPPRPRALYGQRARPGGLGADRVTCTPPRRRGRRPQVTITLAPGRRRLHLP